MNVPSSDRGRSVCRGCGGGPLASVLDLGRQPIANELLASPDDEDSSFELHLSVCTRCGLGQVGEVVLPERLFGADYPYLSSVSTSWVEHARQHVVATHAALDLTDQDLVVEIASNDGYLLRQMRALGPRVLGIEPAGNVAEIARRADVPTIGAFFGADVAADVVAEHGHPRLVVANNVMAHVPDLRDFVAGLAVLCDDRTVVTIENPSFVTLLRETQFDTIYHEHYSYLSAHAVSHVVEEFGLRLVRVDSLTTHGGSNRYWLTRPDTRPVHESVPRAIEAEVSAGLLDEELWNAFRERCSATLSGLREWLDAERRAGRTVAAFGAAAKGNTLLNAAGVEGEEIVAVADGSPAKQGRYLPGSKIPIVSHDELGGTDPDTVLVLPWNLASELTPIVRTITPRARVWVAVPEMTVLAR